MTFIRAGRALRCTAFAALMIGTHVPGHAQPSARPLIQLGELKISGLVKPGDEQVFRSMVETALVGTGRFEVLSTEQALRDARAVAAAQQRPANRSQIRVIPKKPDYLIGGTIAASARQVDNFLVQVACPTVNGQDSYRSGAELTINVDLQVSEVVTNSIKRATHTTKTIKDPAGCMSSNDIDGNKSLRLAANEVALETTRAIYPVAIVRFAPTGEAVLNYCSSVMVAGQYFGVYGDEIRTPNPVNPAEVNISRDRLGYALVSEVQSGSSLAQIKCLAPDQVKPGMILEPVEKRAAETAIRACGRRGRG